ncbi:phage holin family protein [Desulfonatronovibrio magnus]|uniref:phage holin family protein n=1 Tax=Desulfonatronovibrio magnus TaxID=698827 RepID=UPI0005EBB530|nr:phage holin family protein [Desulfonatronovibrio magnus]
MNGLLIRWLILTLSIMLCAYLIDGIVVQSFFSAFVAAAFLGILNALLRPLLILITLPITILTMGLFTFVINAVLLLMVSGVVSGLEIQGFWSALGGALIIALISWLSFIFISDRGRVEYIELKRRGNKWE